MDDYFDGLRVGYFEEDFPKFGCLFRFINILYEGMDSGKDEQIDLNNLLHF